MKKKIIAIIVVAVILITAVVGAFIIFKQGNSAGEITIEAAEEKVNADFDAMAKSKPVNSGGRNASASAP